MPRGPQGRREYCVGNKWLTKIRVAGDGQPPHKFRTLKRKRSDEVATPRRCTAGRVTKRGARKSSALVADRSEVMDCFS